METKVGLSPGNADLLVKDVLGKHEDCCEPEPEGREVRTLSHELSDACRAVDNAARERSASYALYEEWDRDWKRRVDYLEEVKAALDAAVKKTMGQ